MQSLCLFGLRGLQNIDALSSGCSHWRDLPLASRRLFCTVRMTQYDSEAVGGESDDQMNEKNDDITHPGMTSKPEKTRDFGLSQYFVCDRQPYCAVWADTS